jgi:hypothetical protein
MVGVEGGGGEELGSAQVEEGRRIVGARVGYGEVEKGMGRKGWSGGNGSKYGNGGVAVQRWGRWWSGGMSAQRREQREEMCARAEEWRSRRMEMEGGGFYWLCTHKDGKELGAGRRSSTQGKRKWSGGEAMGGGAHTERRNEGGGKVLLRTSGG